MSLVCVMCWQMVGSLQCQEQHRSELKVLSYLSCVVLTCPIFLQRVTCMVPNLLLTPLGVYCVVPVM